MTHSTDNPYRLRIRATKILGLIASFMSLISYFSFMQYCGLFHNWLGEGTYILGLISGFIALVLSIIGASMKMIEMNIRLRSLIPLVVSSLLMSVWAVYLTSYGGYLYSNALTIVMRILLVYLPLGAGVVFGIIIDIRLHLK